MIKPIQKLLISFSTNYWAIPMLFVLGSILLYTFTAFLDQSYFSESTSFLSFQINDPDSLRSILSTIAASMMTVASVSFSMTLLAIEHSSSQIGPRILSGFLDDRGNQFTMGIQCAAFTHSLLTLLLIQAPADAALESLPKVALVVSIIWGLVGIFSFIYFIHHIPHMIRTTYAISKVGSQTRTEILNFFGQKYFINKDTPVPVKSGKEKYLVKTPIHLKENGYLQYFNFEELIKLLKATGLYLECNAKLGDYLIVQGHYFTLYSHQNVAPKIIDQFRNYIILGTQKSIKQDYHFGSHLLLEIGARALSPGVNDPYTFKECVDQLKSSFMILEGQYHNAQHLVDSEDIIRMEIPSFDLQSYFEDIFESLFYYAKDDPQARPHLTRALEEMKKISTDAYFEELIDQYI